MVAEARGLIAGASRIVSSLDVVRGNVIPKTPASRGGRSLWQSLHLTPGRAALAATLMIAISSILTARHDTPGKLIPPSAEAPAAASAAGMPADAPAKPKTVTAPEAVHIVTSPGPRSTLASEAKDRLTTTNAPAREEPKPMKADAIERRDVADASANAVEMGEKKELAKAGPRPEDAPRAQQMQAQVRMPPTIAMDQIAVTGSGSQVCFELMAATVLPPNTPHRFTLQTAPGDTTQHVIRAVNENGQIDSLIPGGTWTRATSTEITVRFAANERTLTLPIRNANGFGTAAAVTEQRSFATRQEQGVSRIACRP
jgi:hypothetical protein